MEVFDGYYYRTGKRLLIYAGLWPYQDLRVKIICNISFTIIHFSLAIPQIIILVQIWGKDLNITFENIISLLFFAVGISKYMTTFFSVHESRILYRQIAKDWQRIKEEEERKILMRHSDEARQLVQFYTVYLFLAWIIYTSMPSIPFILDIIFPLENKTRPLLVPFYGNYIIFEQKEHFLFSCLHISFVYFTCFILYSGVIGSYVLTVKHACGLFDITCYRIENIGKSHRITGNKKLKNNLIVQRDAKNTVILHDDSIRCIDLIEDLYCKCFFFTQCTSVIGIAMGGAYVLTLCRDTLVAFRITIFIFGIVIHLFYLNWNGQQIIDKSLQVFDSAYATEWYKFSSEARKFIILILSRSLKSCKLTAGKLTDLSIESFGILIKTSVSYFTVLLSMNE